MTIVGRAVLGVTLFLLAIQVGCCPPVQAERSDPIDIVKAVCLTLTTGETDRMGPYLFAEDDLKLIVLDPMNPNASKDQDPPQEHSMKELRKEVKQAREQVDWTKLRVASVSFGNQRRIEKLWSLANIRPTDQIEGTVIAFSDAEGKQRMKVELGDLLRIGDLWKLDGWFHVSSIAR